MYTIVFPSDQTGRVRLLAEATLAFGTHLTVSESRNDILEFSDVNVASETNAFMMTLSLWFKARAAIDLV